MQQKQRQTGQNIPHCQHIYPRSHSKRIRILLERTVRKKLLIFVAVNFKLDMILTQKKENFSLKKSNSVFERKRWILMGSFPLTPPQSTSVLYRNNFKNL
jgi:hypothetical protein